MRPVQRAAIGGLFAIWLAPLAAHAGDCSPDRLGAETHEEAPARLDAAAEPAREADTPLQASGKVAAGD
jgi:hypothetical protein